MNNNNKDSSDDDIRGYNEESGENEQINNIFNMVFENDKNFKDNFVGRETVAEEKLLDDKNEELDEENPKRSIMKRFFSPMEEGSLRGSIFAMSSLALGTGCLALPQKFGQMSFVVSLITIIFAALSAYWSLKIMIIVSKKIKCNEYSKCVSFSFGKKAANFLDVVTIIYIFGILISYQVISKNIILI